MISVCRHLHEAKMGAPTPPTFGKVAKYFDGKNDLVCC